jgi:hypothetical protein
MKKIILTLLILLIFTTQIYGTTEYLAKNNITKELFIFEDDRIINYDGLFWKPVSAEENSYKQIETQLLSDGYKYTKNPYKIEILVIIFIIFITLFLFIAVRKNKKNL